MSSTFGWKKDRWDPRDYLHPTMKTVALPASVINKNVPAVRDQGVQGSCVGFGIGAIVTSVTLNVEPAAEWFSPQYIYNGARFIEGTLAQDAGAYPKDALDWLLKNGCLLEHFWPYDPAKFDPAAPSSARIAQANRYPDFAYYRVVDGVDGICSALAAGRIVAIGSPWFSKWMQIGSDGLLPEQTETDPVVGGHEYAVYGYDLAEKIFYCMNSWGSKWGREGHFRLPFSAIDTFKKLWGYDAHYVSFSPGTPPPVPPGPTPSPCKWGNTVAGVMNAVFMQKLRGRKGRFAYVNPAAAAASVSNTTGGAQP